MSDDRGDSPVGDFERAIEAITNGWVAVVQAEAAPPLYSPLRVARYIRMAETSALAEAQDRAERIAGVKQRLGLVTAIGTAEAGTS